jgi:hypothetical protein
VNRAIRRELVKVAARPPARTVDVEVKSGAFAGWAASARADFPAGFLVDLESGTAAGVLSVLKVIVLKHNMPNSKGELAATIAEVEPYDGLMVVAAEILGAIRSLPPR